MPESKYSIEGIKSGISALFIVKKENKMAGQGFIYQEGFIFSGGSGGVSKAVRYYDDPEDYYRLSEEEREAIDEIVILNDDDNPLDASLITYGNGSVADTLDELENNKPNSDVTLLKANFINNLHMNTTFKNINKAVLSTYLFSFNSISDNPSSLSWGHGIAVRQPYFYSGVCYFIWNNSGSASFIIND